MPAAEHSHSGWSLMPPGENVEGSPDLLAVYLVSIYENLCGLDLVPYVEAGNGVFEGS